MHNASTALAERLFHAGIAAMELMTVHIGLRHGLYRALDGLGPTNPYRLDG